MHYPARAFESAPHALGVVGTERHGLLLIDVLAGLKGRDEVESVQVLRGGDQHGVDAAIVEQAPEVRIGLDARSEALHFIMAPGVDVGHRHGLGIRATRRLLQNLLAAPAGADQPDAHAVVRAENPRRAARALGSETPPSKRDTSGSPENLFEKSTTTGHDYLSIPLLTLGPTRRALHVVKAQVALITPVQEVPLGR